jgi:hypothetical protein
LAQHQRHLAFISEFRVQMLYLPNLKNTIANFLSHPPPSPEPLELSSPQRSQIQLTSKPWPPSKTTAEKCSICFAVHPSNLLSDKQAFNTWLVMFP